VPPKTWGREAPVFEIEQEFLPGLFTFAIAVLDRQEFLLPLRGRPDHDQHTMGGFVHPDIEMDAISPYIHVGIREVTCRPLAVVFLPGLLQALDRCGG
jgi:hypothetical protein